MMFLTCATCRRTFPDRVVIEGKEHNLHSRKQCLGCRPLRPRPHARIYRRPIGVKVCEGCGGSFPAKIVVDGRVRSLYTRRFCLACSPFGVHNTSQTPPGANTPEELHEARRRKRNAKTYRSLKKRRVRRKTELIALRGGRCVDCGYSGCLAVFEFHHRDPTTKSFSVAEFSGSLERLRLEAEKCDLLCANCHRLRHTAAEIEGPVDPVVLHRRRRKLRAIAHMGSRCDSCRRDGPPAMFEFHHRKADEKDFGLSESGIPHSWAKVVAELEKCVMLCANCHREVHAGVRELDDDYLLGLAENADEYEVAV